MTNLTTLNDNFLTFWIIILFITLILSSLSFICGLFNKKQLKLNIYSCNLVLNIVLVLVWIFLIYGNISSNHISALTFNILGYYSLINLAFELAIMITKKQWLKAIDFPFFIMLLPIWQYVNISLYLIFVVVATFYLFFRALYIFANEIASLNKNINYYSIKESLDKTTVGLLFEDGFSSGYTNPAFIKLLNNLNIDNRLKATSLWQALTNHKNAVIKNNSDLVIDIDNLKYFFVKSYISNTIQIVAYDITDEYNTTIEIKKIKTELAKKQIDLKDVLSNVEQIEREKEIFKLKSKLHDIIGQRLFILHQVLDNIDFGNFNTKELKLLITNMLIDIEVDDQKDIQNMTNEVVSSFQMVGLKIEIKGKFPNEMNKAKAIIKVIRECATNAIRHAKATILYVNFNGNKIDISDNGKVKVGKVFESTGIIGMRKTIESIGGTLAVDTSKSFKVVIEFSK